MKAKMWLFPLILSVSLNCSGCWDIKDIKTMQVSTCEAIDVAPDPGNNNYYREVLLISGKNWGTKSFQIVPGSGKPFTYVTTDIQSKTGGDFLFSGIKTYIIGRRLAERSLRELIEVSATTTQLPYNIHWVISDGPASELIHINNPAYPNIGEYLDRLLSAIPTSIFIPRTNSFDIALAMHAEASSMIPIIKKDRDDEITITGAGLVDIDKLRVILGREDAQTVSILRGEKVNGRLYMRGPVGKQMEDLVIQIDKFNRRVKVSQHDGRYNFKVIITMNGRVHQDNPSLNFLSDKEFFHQVEGITSRSTQARCLRMISKMQQDWKFDAFNLSKYAHARYGDPPSGVKWGQIVTQSTVEVEVHTLLVGAGEAF